MQRSFTIMCVFRIDVFYINAIEPDNERNNVFFSLFPFFLFCIIKYGQVLWWSVCALCKTKSIWSLCDVTKLQDVLQFECSILSPWLFYENDCWWWVHHALVFFTWIQLNVTMKESTFLSLSKIEVKLHLQVCNHIVNDFGMHHAIGQFVRSYIITRHKMFVKL